MARVTVEDCVDKIENRFDLVMLAARRARNIGKGADLTIERDNDKNPVIALREIADETIGLEEIKQDLVMVHRRVIETDDEEQELDELLLQDGGWGADMQEEMRVAAEAAEAAAAAAAAMEHHDTPFEPNMDDEFEDEELLAPTEMVSDEDEDDGDFIEDEDEDGDEEEK